LDKYRTNAVNIGFKSTHRVLNVRNKLFIIICRGWTYILSIHFIVNSINIKFFHRFLTFEFRANFLGNHIFANFIENFKSIVKNLTSTLYGNGCCDTVSNISKIISVGILLATQFLLLLIEFRDYVFLRFIPNNYTSNPSHDSW
jgi:hypothetical protein